MPLRTQEQIKNVDASSLQELVGAFALEQILAT
jgi:hypothetical protein